MAEIRYLTVTALTRYIKAKLEGDRHLKTIYLRGEISNFKAHSRGHMYFTLKDAQARISCVMFSTQNQRINFLPKDGMKVFVTAEIGVYEPGGNYQLYVQQMEQDGIGNLHIAFEELKKKLNEEGLFSSMFKKELPKYPRRIGVITSPTGAAIRDVLTTLNRRYPIAEVFVFPVLVQGEYAASSIVRAIQQANSQKQVDVIILGRGGGSIEELWAFNEEVVARAIYDSQIPIVSAVGHETDFTISDFVADMRAPTPTGAAELVTPHVHELAERLLQREKRLIQSTTHLLQGAKKQLNTLTQSYAFKYPNQLYRQKEQQFDRLIEQLNRAGIAYVSNQQVKVKQLHLQIEKFHPKQELKLATERLSSIEKELVNKVTMLIDSKNYLFRHLNGQLDALSPLKIMNRGYSLAFNEDHELVKSVTQVKEKEHITLEMIDGKVVCKVEGIQEGL